MHCQLKSNRISYVWLFVSEENTQRAVDRNSVCNLCHDVYCQQRWHIEPGMSAWHQRNWDRCAMRPKTAQKFSEAAAPVTVAGQRRIEHTDGCCSLHDVFNCSSSLLLSSWARANWPSGSAWHLPGGPAGLPARWAAASNVKRPSGTWEGTPTLAKIEEWLNMQGGPKQK